MTGTFGPWLPQSLVVAVMVTRESSPCLPAVAVGPCFRTNPASPVTRSLARKEQQSWKALLSLHFQPKAGRPRPGHAPLENWHLRAQALASGNPRRRRKLGGWVGGGVRRGSAAGIAQISTKKMDSPLGKLVSVLRGAEAFPKPHTPECWEASAVHLRGETRVGQSWSEPEAVGGRGVAAVRPSALILKSKRPQFNIPQTRAGESDSDTPRKSHFAGGCEATEGRPRTVEDLTSATLDIAFGECSGRVPWGCQGVLRVREPKGPPQDAPSRTPGSDHLLSGICRFKISPLRSLGQWRVPRRTGRPPWP